MRNSGDLVSVVMPVYNGERFLRDAVDSILLQTYRNFELIVVDDGSSDRTADILDAYEMQDSRVRVHRHERNAGIVAARNQGCRMARGGFIAVMDADDISLPHRLEIQFNYLRSHPEIAAVGGWVRRIDQNGLPGEVQHYPLEPAILAWSMLFFNSVAHPVVMFRSE